MTPEQQAAANKAVANKAASDQGMKEMADVLHIYYSELRSAGFTDDQAIFFTSQYHSFLFSFQTPVCDSHLPDSEED